MEHICRNTACETFRRSVNIIAVFFKDSTRRSTNTTHNFP